MKTALLWVARLLAAAVLLGALMNPIVTALLRSPLHGVLSGSVLLLSLPAGETIPVNYRREGQQILIGCDFDWWTQLGEATPVTLRVAGQELAGRAQVVADEAERVAGFKRLRPTTYERALTSGARLVRVTLD